MLDTNDRLKVAADSLKWELVALALLATALYLVRLSLLEAAGELESARVRAARAENELEKREQQLDQALAHIHKTQNGDDEPAGE